MAAGTGLPPRYVTPRPPANRGAGSAAPPVNLFTPSLLRPKPLPNRAPFRPGAAPEQVTQTRRAASPIMGPQPDERVVQIQQHLKNLGYNVQVDGLMGPETRAAMFVSHNGTQRNALVNAEHSSRQAQQFVHATKPTEHFAPSQQLHPYFEGQKPTGQTGAWRTLDGRIILPGQGNPPPGSRPTNVPLYSKPNGHFVNPETMWSPTDEQAAQHEAVQTQGLAGSIFRQTAESLVPTHSINKIADGHVPTVHDVAADVGTTAADLVGTELGARAVGAVADAVRLAKIARDGGDARAAARAMREAHAAIADAKREAAVAKTTAKFGESEKALKQQSIDHAAGQDLQGLPTVGGVKYRSNAHAQEIADKYMKDAGLAHTPPTEHASVDSERAARIAQWYDQAAHAAHDPKVKASYEAMARETLAQYHAIEQAGYKFEFYPKGVDPYPSGPRAAIDDLRDNKHMYVYPTDAGFGTESAATADHPLLADSGVRWGDQPVTHNDVFRAVHDFMGHYKEGVGFRADGEENAWRAHSAMYSPEARPAMTAETRGQNSWVNYGPHGETNRSADQASTVYADQKAVLAPDWVIHEGSGQPQPINNDMLEAAAVSVHMMGPTEENIAKTAAMFNVDPEALRAAVDHPDTHGTMSRILSNADVGAGPASTFDDAATILDRAEREIMSSDPLVQHILNEQGDKMTDLRGLTHPQIEQSIADSMSAGIEREDMRDALRAGAPDHVPAEWSSPPTSHEVASDPSVDLHKAARSLVRRFKDTAPPDYKTPAKLRDLLKELRTRAVAAEQYRKWYANSAEGIMAHVHGDVQEADKLAALVAIYSPRAEVYSKSTEWNNLDRAINAYNEFKDGGTISPKWSISSHKEGEADWQTHRATQIMQGNFEWSGLKTNRFYRNFLQHIDPAKYAQLFGEARFGTMDTWMRRAFKYPAQQKTEARETLFGTEHVPVGKKQEPITPRMYAFMEQATKAIADSLGWSPEEAQAAIWTSVKAESEGTPLEQAGFDFRDAFGHREARNAKPLKPEQLSVDMSTADKPLVSDVDAAIEASRHPDSGFTLTAGLRPDPGEGGYIVAYGAHEARSAAPLTQKALLDYRNAHLDLLRSDPTLRIGGWHNPEDGKIYLDISRVFDNAEEAHAFAREQGQVAIYDRASGTAPGTGLDPAEADSIKASLKESARLEGQGSKYDNLLANAYRMIGGNVPRSGKLSEAAAKDAENALFDWAAKHPDAPEAKQLQQLYDEAHKGKQSRVPSWLSDESGSLRPGSFFGRKPEPYVPPTDFLEGEGPGLREQVQGALSGARSVRGKQEAGYSAERSTRAAAAESAMQRLGGLQGYHAALGELRGELPKINFAGFNELTPEALDAMLTHIQQHDAMSPFSKIRAQTALVKAVEGRVPTKSEITLLENVFGKQTTSGLQHIPKMPEHMKNLFMEVLNVPRSVMASFDLSAPFRQGLVVSTRHPDIFFRNFDDMFKSFGSERAYQGLMDDIAARPTFPMMEAAKLAITDMEGLGQREEQFYSNLAERLTGGFSRKGGLHMTPTRSPIRMSGRAYTGFLVKTRADVFDHLVSVAHVQGIDVQDRKFLESLGTYINAATGRGDLGRFQDAATILNSIFFSPRLLASRLNFLNPLWYAKLHPFVRAEALRSAIQLTGGALTLLSLAAMMPGVNVNVDPRNADFGKMRFGNTRLDVLGGFQQPIRLLAQLTTGKIISSTTGDPLTLGPQGPGAVSRRDILQRFFEGKLAPTPSVINDWFKGTDFQGRPFSWKKETVSHMVPLLAQDTTDLYRQGHGGMNGISAALAGYGIGAFGVGLQTYGPKDPGASAQTKLQRQAKAAGMPPPSPQILLALDHKKNLDSITGKHRGDKQAALKDAVKYYVKVTGKHNFDSAYIAAKRDKSGTVADTFLGTIRTILVGPGLSAYESAVKTVAAAKGVK